MMESHALATLRHDRADSTRAHSLFNQRSTICNQQRFNNQRSHNQQCSQKLHRTPSRAIRGLTVVRTLPKLAPVCVLELRIAGELVTLNTSNSPSSLVPPTLTL